MIRQGWLFFIVLANFASYRIVIGPRTWKANVAILYRLFLVLSLQRSIAEIAWSGDNRNSILRMSHNGRSRQRHDRWAFGNALHAQHVAPDSCRILRGGLDSLAASSRRGFERCRSTCTVTMLRVLGRCRGELDLVHSDKAYTIRLANDIANDQHCSLRPTLRRMRNLVVGKTDDFQELPLPALPML